jgi:anti-anti-sigma regulatory factor
MPESACKPVYYVNAYSEPILVRIEGRASFQNSSGLKDFMAEMIRQGKGAFVVDFLRCTGMDSTFLGVLAGAALELRKKPGRHSLVLVRVGPRNLELVRNLGLHRLLTVDSGEFAMNFDKGGAVLPSQDRTELENARLVLEAHENLVAAEGGNAVKFQDVLVFLKSRVAGS